MVMREEKRIVELRHSLKWSDRVLSSIIGLNLPAPVDFGTLATESACERAPRLKIFLLKCRFQTGLGS